MQTKEVIERLVKYFMQQDKEIMSRILANMLIDFNQIQNITILPKDEKKQLLIRIKNNSETVVDFIKNGPEHDLDYTIMNMQEE